MFGYSRTPGVASDNATPGGLSIDGGISAAGGLFNVDSSGNPSFNCANYYTSANQVTQYADNVTWLRSDSTPVITQVTDGSIRFWHGVDSRAAIKCSAGIGLFGHAVPVAAQSITGSRAAMGVSTYQIIQALAATGIIIDDTTA